MKEYFKKMLKRTKEVLVVALWLFLSVLVVFPLIMINAVFFPLQYILTGKTTLIAIDLFDRLSDTMESWTS